MKTYCGIDLGVKSSAYCFIDEQGEVVAKREAPTPIPFCGSDRVEKPERPIDQPLPRVTELEQKEKNTIEDLTKRGDLEKTRRNVMLSGVEV